MSTSTATSTRTIDLARRVEAAALTAGPDFQHFTRPARRDYCAGPVGANRELSVQVEWYERDGADVATLIITHYVTGKAVSFCPTTTTDQVIPFLQGVLSTVRSMA